MLNNVYFLLITFIIICGLKKWEVIKDKRISTFIYYEIVVLFVEILSIYIGKKYHTNAIVFNYAFYAFWILQSALFYAFLPSSYQKKIFVAIVAIVFLAIIYFHSKITWKQLNINGYMIVLITLVIFIFQYFINLISNPSEENIVHNGMFWICLGFLIQSIVILFFISPYKVTFIKYESFAKEMTKILKYCNILVQCIFAIGIILCQKYRKTLN